MFRLRARPLPEARRGLAWPIAFDASRQGLVLLGGARAVAHRRSGRGLPECGLLGVGGGGMDV